MDEEEYTYGVSGKLIMNGLVLYDRETDTHWAQLPGIAVSGPLEGTRLEYLPSWQTTWAEWRTRHPETGAVDKGTNSSSDRYGTYYASSGVGPMGETVEDDRLAAKDLVIGIDWNGEQIAYPFSQLKVTPVVNDSVSGTPVVIVFYADTETGLVFEREVEGETLTFELGSGDILTLDDAETGSTWDGWEGIATAGPLEGQSLERVRSTYSFWFTWKDWYPGTRVFGED
jgi:hypothetical protein